jgi:diguanylate cyclase (GGDEF)-like protein
MSRIRHFFMDGKLAGLEKLLFVSIVLTCLALLAGNTLIKTHLTLKPGSPYKTSLGDDQPKGGASTAEWVDKSMYEWRCTLRQKYEYPYCLFQVLLGGVDLSKYETMTITLEYTGNKLPTDSVRFFLRNNTPIYRQEGSVESLKYNEVEIPANRLDQPYVVHLTDFDIPDWWLRQFNIAPENAQTEFDDVIFLEITTGTGAPPGDYHFKLYSIEWEGNLIPREEWYLGIIVVWLSFLFSVLVYRVWRLKSEIDAHYARAQNLQQLNQILDTKSKYFEKMAKTDPLTGVSNRGGIGDFLLREIRNHIETGNPLTVILLDVDHFKQINDTHGHDHGDTVLVKVAHTLTEYLRTSDAVARWGGEEFLLVCPNTSLESGKALAEKLRYRIKNLGAEGSTLSASFGVATLGNESIEKLIKRVDEALYRAKQNGRDRVEISEAA